MTEETRAICWTMGPHHIGNTYCAKIKGRMFAVWPYARTTETRNGNVRDIGGWQVKELQADGKGKCGWGYRSSLEAIRDCFRLVGIPADHPYFYTWNPERFHDFFKAVTE